MSEILRYDQIKNAIKTIGLVGGLLLSNLQEGMAQENLARAIEEKKIATFTARGDQLPNNYDDKMRYALNPSVITEVVNVLRQKGFEAKAGWFEQQTEDCTTAMCCTSTISIKKNGVSYVAILERDNSDPQKITLRFCDYVGRLDRL